VYVCVIKTIYVKNPLVYNNTYISNEQKENNNIFYQYIYLYTYTDIYIYIDIYFSDRPNGFVTLSLNPTTKLLWGLHLPPSNE
jgi:hypothetical protein